MTLRIVLLMGFTGALAVGNARGHGIPIDVEQNGSLVVSGGTADAVGFADMMFVQSGGDGAPFATTTLPNVGPVVIWQVPGMQIDGLDPTSNLAIEVVARPVNNQLPVQYQSVWYWNPTTSVVAPTTSPMYLLGTGARFTTIDPAGTPPTPFALAEPLGGTEGEGGAQGFHNHGLLSFALDNSPTAPTGVYGFFARLKSNLYAPSDPFLVMLNRGAATNRVLEAAQAINAAAFLPGDFNHDDRVDAADYVVWRNNINTGPEYNLWRGDFGAVVPALGGSAMSAPSVPEPATIVTAALFVVLLTGVAPLRRRQVR